MPEWTCECIECGYKMETERHCNEIKCPECGGDMRRAERPGPGQKKMALDWSKLIFGSYSPEEIAKAVDDQEWQDFRESLEGTSTDEKYEALLNWMKKHRQSKKAKIQVTNYVNALARGGIIVLQTCPAGWVWDDDMGKCVEMKSLSQTMDDDLYDLIASLPMEGKVKVLMEFAEKVEYDDKRTLPYPNEHACRKKQPGQFDSFYRTSRTSNGKRYDIIWGIKDNKATEQAYRYPKDIWSVEQARSHCKRHHGISFEPAKNVHSMMIWSNVDPEEKYVLSEEAVTNGDIPPVGMSGIPSEMESKIPKRFIWWLAKDPETRVKLRDAYLEATTNVVKILHQYDEERFLIECGNCNYYLARFFEQPEEGKELTMADVSDRIAVEKPDTKDFVLMHHFWRGIKSFGGKPTTEHFDLFIGDEQLVCLTNPSAGETVAVSRKPYSVSFHEKGANDYDYIVPGQPGNPTRNTPSWVRQMDAGQVTLVESTRQSKIFDFKGKKFKGRYQLSREDETRNIWKMQKIQSPTLKMALSEGESIHKANIHMSLTGFHMDGDDMIVEGTALSYGVWNGEYFPEEAIMDRPERIVGIPIAVGSHATQKNSGKVEEFKATNGSIWVSARIPKEFSVEQERVRSGEFVGWSVEVDVVANEKRRIIMKILGYDRVVLVDMPACTVCTLGAAS